MMVRTDGWQYSKDNIRINCICPGVIATPMTVATPSFAESLKVAIAIAPMNRMGTAQEIADAALFLSSSKATFIQGVSLVSFLPGHVQYITNTNRWWMVVILSINRWFAS